MTETTSGRRLRVAIVTPGFVVERDEPGMPAIVDLVERIGSLHDCEVIALRHPPARQAYRVAGVRVTALGAGAAAGPRGRASVLARGSRRCCGRHRRRPFDLLHALWADEAGAVATIAGRLVRRPVVVSVLGGELVGDPRHRLRSGPGPRRAVDAAHRARRRGPRDGGVVHDARRDRRAAAGDPVARLPLGVDTTVFRPAEPASAAARGDAGIIGTRPADDPVRRQPGAGQGPGGPAPRLRSPGGRPSGARARARR